MSYLLGNYGRFDYEPLKGEGHWIEDKSGRRILDLGAGIAVSSLGHAHPAMVQALSEQSAKLIHCTNLYRIPQQEKLAAHLVEKIMRKDGRCFFCNSGAEANEALLKLARAYGQQHPDGVRTEIVTFSGSFHGRTFGGISATAQSKIKNGFGPLLPDFTHLPYNDADGVRNGVSEKTAAVLLEIVQGESGINAAQRDFLEAIAQRCEETGALLLVDEVQAGFGRTGHPVAWETVLGENHDSFRPHAVSWAKGLGGGFPIGAVWISTDEVAGKEAPIPLTSVLGPGMHGTTFGGSPLASTVGLAVLETIEKENLTENAAKSGPKIMDAVSAIDSPYIREVRGLGLMIGIVLDTEALANHESFAASGQAPSIWAVNELLDRGVLVIPAGTDVIRILPALNFDFADFATADAAIRDLLSG